MLTNLLKPFLAELVNKSDMMNLNINRVVRDRIEEIPKTVVRKAFKFQYLTATRISEVCGKYAVTGKDLEIKEFEGHSLALFTIKTAKKKGEPRFIALPLEEEYEPWSLELVKEFSSRDDRRVFPISVRSLQFHAEKAFETLDYTIEKYGNKKIGVIEKHERPGLTHFLRHVRATNLVMDYGFDSTDIGIYCGWEIGLPAMAKRYITMEWRRYFPKLLKPIETKVIM